MRRGVPGCAVLLALGALACSEDEPTSPDLEYADPRYWSGGALTVFSPAAQAYSTPAPNVSNLALHLEGDRLVEVGRIAGHDVPFGGLGPTFNSISCAQCHFSDGRSMPDSWRLGGSGAGSTNFLIRISTPEGSPVPGYGTVIQDQATFGAVPEAKVSVTMRSARNGQFADGEPFELVVPRVTFGDWYSGTAPKPFAFSLRIPARQVGLAIIATLKDHGLLDRVRRVVKVLGMVNATPDFADHPAVINGCSDLMNEVFGERGVHARSAVGFGSLPNQITVEIEAVVAFD